jgi:hypothetical protein
VYHFQQFSHCQHGKLNAFTVQNKLECLTDTLTTVLLDSHRDSSDYVHVSVSYYDSLPCILLRTCGRIASLVVAMLCRVAQSQLPTHLFCVFVHPGVWNIIKKDIQDNYHSTTYLFFIDQVEVRVKKKPLHFVDEVLHLVTDTVSVLTGFPATPFVRSP